MGMQFETVGNASVQVLEDGRPLLMTDPWLRGTAYFGSWALDWPLEERQVRNATSSPFLWFSHGHQDHLHHESVELLDKENQEVLVPDHYSPEIEEHFKQLGFRTRVLKYRQWTPLADGLRVMCLEHHNQDAILVIEAGDALIINRNDCPMGGEKPFFRRLVRRYPKSFLLSICAIDADMLNLVDARGNPAMGPPDERKPGAIWDLSDLCTYLGVGYKCCSSSQHLYVRQDALWANPYRITYEDVARYWNAEDTELVPPFVRFDLDAMTYVENHPSHESDWAAVTDATGDDDWDQPMTAEDWAKLEAFFARFELLGRRLDFVRFTIAGETRDVWRGPSHDARPEAKRRGMHFRAPRNSLLECVHWGYFDDLLIGNFMKTEPINASLYPDFTPIVAKLGGNARVFTAAERAAFRRRYLKQNATAFLRDGLDDWWLRRGKPFLRDSLSNLGVLEFAKRAGRRVRNLPPLPSPAEGSGPSDGSGRPGQDGAA